jgi:hypothetical protein
MENNPNNYSNEIIVNDTINKMLIAFDDIIGEEFLSKLNLSQKNKEHFRKQRNKSKNDLKDTLKDLLNQD